MARGPRDFELIDVPEPGVGSGGAVLAVTGAGVCAADRMLWRGDGPWPASYPFVPGHEVVGRVEDISGDSSHRWGVSPGDLVGVEVMVPCGRCRLCAIDRENLCRCGAHLGSDLPGGFADRVHVPPAARVHLIPPSVPPRAAALLEPLANAVHAVRRAGPEPGQDVVVIGLGAVGALVVQVLRALAPEVRVVAVVNRNDRAALARTFGAERVIVAPPDAPAEAMAELAELGGGLGAERVLELSGDPRAAALALRAAGPGGRVCLYGVYREPATVDLNQVAEFKELDVVGGHLAPAGAFARAVQLLDTGQVAADAVATDVLPLDRFQEALDPPADGRVRLKTVLVPNPWTEAA